MEGRSNWIWLADWRQEEEEKTTLVQFRKEMYLAERPESFPIQITADSRYKLYINGEFCTEGPAKGDDKIWFLDEIETEPYLKKGRNVWEVTVMRRSLQAEKGCLGIFCTKTPGLFIKSAANILRGFCTDESWQGRRLTGIHFVAENPFFAPLQIQEQTSWTVDQWGAVREYDLKELSEILCPDKICERPIPLMEHGIGKWKGISKFCQTSMKEKWYEFVDSGKPLEIPPHKKEIIDLDAKELQTAYLILRVAGGAGASVRLLHAEAYAFHIPDPPKSYEDLPLKKDREDAAQGELSGFMDIYEVSGRGTVEEPECYEPFWFRTFRFVKLEIETREEPLRLLGFSYRTIGYPLDVKTRVKTSDPDFSAIWDMSLRTLKRCMHETYEDCPFYEQLQYSMDARNEILYTYAVSADDRLARRCMEDFRRSQRADGMLNACYPSVGKNVIPGFSIYYIGMLYDHMMYFGDKGFLRRHRLAMERILNWFGRNLDERGLVRKVGDINRPKNSWSFIDWTPQWDATTGVPPATLKGAVTMESLLYLLGMQYAETICRYLGDEEKANRYQNQAKGLRKAVRKCCTGENGMIQDGPGIAEYSQHCQVFAVLTGLVSEEEGAQLLIETLEHKEKYAQCSVAMMFYLFRALEKCGIYERTKALWSIWRDMLSNHLTTCAEDNLRSRSDCHAWGALLLYELPSVILGVRPTAPGYEKMEAEPAYGYLKWAKGSVVTPKGMVDVHISDT